ncbi:DUF2017 domain-containing protein [Cryobacterium sp. TMT2-23]|uniref:DUF2017 domain-containing protein n=1 Tax=Cryobacterium sp. TMT2-23 TaxID=1259252 RepID=UPI00141B663B|nr:DUF2017 domain-containing protein [Cryobacterium sp. TMT2-23]
MEFLPAGGETGRDRSNGRAGKDSQAGKGGHAGQDGQAGKGGHAGQDGQAGQAGQAGRASPTGESAGSVTAQFEPAEVGLLRMAARQLIELLEAAESHALGTSVDPALRRLLPDAYTDDPEAAAEFRRFTAGDLLERKVRNARVVIATLGEELADEIADDAPETLNDDDFDEPATTITLDRDDVQSWLRTLTDLRLTLAERLEISPDGVVHLAEDEAPFLHGIYEWLGMVQESLVYAIDV